MSDFDRVKEAINLPTVLASLSGFELQKAGVNLFLSECPFCGHKGCFSVPPNGKYAGSYKCHSCDQKGDIFSYLEKKEGLDTHGALERAAKLANVKLEVKPGKKKELTTLEKIRIEAAEYYHSKMLENGGKEYFLEKRQQSLETVTSEKCGWSDGRLLDHLRSKGFSDREILDSGLVKEREVGTGNDKQMRLFDFFSKGLAVFPHWSHGKVLHFTMKDPRDIPADEKLKYQLKNEQRDKRWTFYGQDVLYGDKYQEVILVEGEHDRLQILNSGIPYVCAMIGSISDDQLKALASRGIGKHLYLWVDNDHAGRGYVRKIAAALSNMTIRVIVFGKPDDDPDSYLKSFEGDRKREVRRLQLEAVDYITWEIQQAAMFPTLEKRRRHLQEPGIFDKKPDQLEGKSYTSVLRLIGRQTIIQQDIYKEKLEELGFSREAIDEALDFSQDLRKQITDYQEIIGNPKDVDPIVMGEIIFKFFAHHGRFYYDREDNVYLIYQNHTYVVEKNTAFNALMLKMARMIPEVAPGTQVWSAIKHIAYLNGRRIDMSRWIHTDTDKDTIYYNLNSPNNVVLKLSKERIEEIQNGMNDDHVLLASSHKIMPFNFMPDAEIKEGFTLLKELIFDNLAVKREQRFLILCWLISGFCPDFAPYQFLMKFEGYASSGKSTAAKLITALLYKSEDLSDSSAAAAFSSAAKNPIVVIDNLENKDLNRGLQKFLLLAATRGQKEKRKGGTDTDTVDESPRALICVTAIEPFTLSELISRTFVLPFDRRAHGSDNFHESEIVEQIKKKRDLIISATLRFIQKELLSSLDQRKEFMTILNKQFKGHSKDRTNAYLALLMLILEKTLKYIPYVTEDDLLFGIETGDKDIYTAWIEEQNSTSRETETGSNTILHFLDGLIREHLQHFKGKIPVLEDGLTLLEHPEYGLHIIKHEPEEITDQGNEKYHRTVFEFVATSAEVVDAFDRYAKNTNKRNTYDSASIFTARLRNDLDLLKKNGWELESSPGNEPYFKIIRGKRFLKFKHSMIR